MSVRCRLLAAATVAIAIATTLSAPPAYAGTTDLSAAPQAIAGTPDNQGYWVAGRDGRR